MKNKVSTDFWFDLIYQDYYNVITYEYNLIKTKTDSEAIGIYSIKFISNNYMIII